MVLRCRQGSEIDSVDFAGIGNVVFSPATLLPEHADCQDTEIKRHIINIAQSTSVATVSVDDILSEEGLTCSSNAPAQLTVQYHCGGMSCLAHATP